MTTATLIVTPVELAYIHRLIKKAMRECSPNIPEYKASIQRIEAKIQRAIISY